MAYIHGTRVGEREWQVLDMVHASPGRIRLWYVRRSSLRHWEAQAYRPFDSLLRKGALQLGPRVSRARHQGQAPVFLVEEVARTLGWYPGSGKSIWHR